MNWSYISFTDRTIRQFAGIWIVFFGQLAIWQWLFHDRTTLGIILGILAVTLGPLGLWKPSILRPIYTVWMIAVFPIGWVVSHVVLAILFYGVFTPVAVFFRLVGRDSMKRSYDSNAVTYWQEKPGNRDVKSYFRQY